MDTGQSAQENYDSLFGGDLLTDMTRLASLQERVRQEIRSLQDTFAAMVDAVITTDQLGCINYCNVAAEHLVKSSSDLVIGRTLDDALKLQVGKKSILIPSGAACLGSMANWNVPNGSTLLRGNGEEVAIGGNVTPIFGTHGDFVGSVAVLRSGNFGVGDTESVDPGISIDHITGLVNRSEFERRLRSWLVGSESSHRGVLLYLDLDEFKIVNDTCGHVAGDALLWQVAQALQNRMNLGDILGRLGGDEFGILLNQRDLAEAWQIADEICRAIQAINFAWEDRLFRGGVSIGMVQLKCGVDDVISVMRDADRACYAAKEGGRNQVYLFGDEGPEFALQAGHMNALSMLNDAIISNRLTLFAQPIVQLGNKDEFPHVEILLRMFDANGDIRGPATFLSAAERYHQMPMVDRWVVARTFELISDLGITDQYIFAINLSGQSIGRRDFLEFVIENLETQNVNPAQICFEITEGAAITNVDGAQNFISVLRQRGCRFALDDFGVGMSSLSYLRRLPIDYLKIDRSFICEIGSDSMNEAMVRAIHQVAKVANVKTVAESVESVADLRMLATIGIDLIQGYLAAVPIPLEKLPQISYAEIHARLAASLKSSCLV